MILTRLELFNFRNYTEQEVEFSPGRNLIIGSNAQGKSNLLEAVYFLSHLKSSRAPRAGDLIRENEQSLSVTGVILEEGKRVTVKVKMSNAGKQVLINGQKTAQPARARGIIKCVLFSPDDLYLVKGDPARRREFLDETLEGVGPAQASELSEYRHLLRQRNAVLRKWEDYGAGLGGALSPWTEGLVDLGGKIVSERLRMTGEMSALVKLVYGEISGGGKAPGLQYQGSFDVEGKSPGELAKAMRRELEARREEEKRLRSTPAGPHRDDVVIRLGGRETRYGASQGEQRTLAFCLRIAQKEYIQETTGKRPVLLLDDVLSELDEGRRKRVLEMAGAGSQVLMTTTDVPGGMDIGGAKVLRVEAGRVCVE